MKALSGYAEWFWLMAKHCVDDDGWKDIENREWCLYKYIKPENLPQTIYLHASKTKASRDEISFIRRNLNEEQRAEFDSVNWNKYRGTLFATIELVEDVTSSNSKWFFGKHGFIIRNGEFLPEPILYKGRLGIWEVNDV